MAKKRKLKPIHVGIVIVAIFVLSQLGMLNQLFAVGDSSRQVTNDQCTLDLFNNTDELLVLPCEEVEQWVKDNPWAWIKGNTLAAFGIFAFGLLLVYLIYIPEK